jgi:SAM-dependent methyltransferase
MVDYKYTKEEAYRLYRENPESFFEEIIHPDADNESKLIHKNWPLFWTRYHYNLVENDIMEIVVKYDLPVQGANILDIGSGTGHWIDFYRTCFEPAQLWGVDFAQKPLNKLKKKFDSDIHLRCSDISSEVPGELGANRFDIINAIGIIFHIVDDEKWRQAISNLASLLKDAGILIIGGDFSGTTQERGVMRKTRSLREWRDLAASLDLNILEVKRHNWWAGADRGGLTDNLMALGRFSI